ncbi:MAG: hypothetical protein ACI9PX_000131 [Reinekea sp.]|jgi:hypothetical protein
MLAARPAAGMNGVLLDTLCGMRGQGGLHWRGKIRPWAAYS